MSKAKRGNLIEHFVVPLHNIGIYCRFPDLCREHGMSNARFYQWLWTYNNKRPHTAIGGVLPRQLLKAA